MYYKPGSKAKWALTWLLALILALAVSTAATAGAQPAVVRIDILTVNDFHGALAEEGKNPGAAKLAGFLQAERAKNPEGTLILSAGDMFQGTQDSNLLYGKTAAEVMNRIGFDAMALGNHEFDWGMDVLKARMAQARFPFLAANVLDSKDAMLFTPYTIIEKAGLKIGIIGIATPETAYKANPKLVSAFRFADPAQTVKRLLPELKAQGAQIVIVLSHLGAETDTASRAITGEAAVLAASAEGIDALVTGHTHTEAAGKINGVPIVQALYNGRAVGKISLTYSPGSNQMIASEAAVLPVPPQHITPDAAVQKLIQAAQAEIGPVKNIVVGTAARPLSHDRRQLSLLGQWTSDILRQAAGADIAFQNGGGLRTGIPRGKITMGLLYEVSPFDNTLVTCEMTGAQVLAVLEYGIGNAGIGMLQYSGLKVKHDPDQPAGKRVVAVRLTDGRLLDLNQRYTVATNDFMASGGDGFTMFKAAANLKDTFLPVRDLFKQAIQAKKTLRFTGDDRLVQPDRKQPKKNAA